MRLQEQYKDGSHANEVISYVVLEEGAWDLTDGTQIAAGSKVQTNYQRKVAKKYPLTIHLQVDQQSLLKRKHLMVVTGLRQGRMQSQEIRLM